VQRADVGEHGAVLKVREPGRTTFVVVGGGGAGVGISEARVAKPDRARSVGRIEGFRVAWVSSRGVGLARATRAEGAAEVEEAEVVERARVDAGRDGRVKLSVGDAAWGDAEAAEGALEEERAQWVARGERLASEALVHAVEARRGEALRALKRGRARIARRTEAVRGDLARIGDAEALASRAQWLVAEASRAPRGATSLKVVDWSSGEAQTLEVPLDPSKPARAQVDAMFQRARRLKLGGKVAGERLAQAERMLAALEPLEDVIAAATGVGAIEEAMTRARAIAPKDVKIEPPAGPPGSHAHRGQAKSPPFRTFHARSGPRVLVGRGAAQNDLLTFQIARPHDLWLHAKGYPGAHVIVPLAKNQSCPGDVLVEAAHLAAHFSDARDEAVVDVQYVARRHLRKPRGSAPGLVVVEREKVIAVRIDAATLRALLESEEA
jgi:predicted ribosome quality control (RQC) complex YloA/Tae2 family protein